MNTFIPGTVNFNELVKSNNKMSIRLQNKMINKMNETFDDEEQKWYVANFYIYMNYHPTDDFPINLEDVYGMIGFINKANAKKTLVNNFTENIDYKTQLIHSDKLTKTNGYSETIFIQRDENKLTDESRNRNTVIFTKEKVMLNDDDVGTKTASPVAEAVLQEEKHNLGGSGSNKYYVSKKAAYPVAGAALLEGKHNLGGSGSNKDYVDVNFASPVGEAKNKEETRGRKQEIIMLNIDTFKNLCMIARTEKGKKIRKYYVKLENIFNQMNKETMDEQVKVLSIENKQEILLREYSKECSLVYLIKVKTIDENKYILKIGESRGGVLSRYQEHKKNYEECLLLDCFLVKNSKRLEKFLHNKYSMNRYKELENHTKENELFLIGEELTYQQITNTIKENIHSYDDTQYVTEENLKLQIDLMKLENKNLQLQIEKLSQQKEISVDYERIEQIVRKVVQENKQQNISDNFNQVLPTIGPRVQQINPENMTLVKVYENVAEVCKYFKIPRSSLTKAYKENTIYKNYRWNFVERDQDPTKIINLQETKHLSKIYNLGYIAKINSDKTKIISVYLDRKTASLTNGYNSTAFLDSYVKNNKICDNFYYVLYDNLEDKIKDNFLNGKDIILYKSGIGQFDKNGQLVGEFRSKHHCQQELKIGEKSLNKALFNGCLCNDYYYKFLEEKLFV